MIEDIFLTEMIVKNVIIHVKNVLEVARINVFHVIVNLTLIDYPLIAKQIPVIVKQVIMIMIKTKNVLKNKYVTSLVKHVLDRVKMNALAVILMMFLIEKCWMQILINVDVRLDIMMIMIS